MRGLSLMATGQTLGQVPPEAAALQDRPGLPLAGARRRRPRHLRRRAQPDDRQRGAAAHHPDLPGDGRSGPARAHDVHAGAGRLHAGDRLPDRSPGDQARLPRLGRAVHPVHGALRARAHHGRADRLPRPPGDRRRDGDAARHGDHLPDGPAPRARRRDGDVRAAGAGRPDDRPGPGRLPGGRRRLAADLPARDAGRDRGRAVRHGDPPRDAAQARHDVRLGRLRPGRRRVLGGAGGALTRPGRWLVRAAPGRPLADRGGGSGLLGRRRADGRAPAARSQGAARTGPT